MQFLVIGEVRDTVVGAEAVRRIRENVGKTIQKAKASGKMQAGGILGGKRMPFMLIEADSSEELLELLADVIDDIQFDVYPVLSFETLGKFFAEHPM
jgi:hypothetical protein